LIYSNETDMKLFKSILVIGILFASTANHAQFTDQINTNRPGESMGAFSVGKNVYQAEGGLYYVKENHNLYGYDAKGFGAKLSFRGGLFFEQLELIVDAQFQMDKFTSTAISGNRSGLKQTTFGGKYLFYDPFKGKEEKPNIYSWKANHRFKWKQFIPALSGYIGVNYTMANDYSIPNKFTYNETFYNSGEKIEEESSISPKVMVIAQNHFGTKWVLVTNIVADKVTSTAKNFGYILTLTRGINEHVSVFVESKGIKGDYYSDCIFSLGGTYLLEKNMQIDASFSKNIKDTPSLFYGSLGFSWRFDKKHKDIQIKDGKEVKGKEDKKKSKDQKRLDEIEGGKK